MPVSKVSRLSRKWCVVFSVFAVLTLVVLVQMTTSAAQSPNSAAQDDFTVWYVAIAVLGAAFCASLFWWRREKTKEEVVTHRETVHAGIGIKTEERPRRRPPAGEIATDFSKVKVETPSWIRESLNNQQTLSTNSANGHAAPKNNGRELPVFEMIDLPVQATPLPTSGESVLFEAVEKLQQLGADEDEREAAVTVLSAFRTVNAVEALEQVAQYDESTRIRIGALNALGTFDHESVFEPILLACADISREVRAAAARILTRLSVDRAAAFNRIIASGDTERLRLAAMACTDAGFANHAFDRLLHQDRKVVNEAFAIVRLLVAAGDYKPITNTITHPHDIYVRLATIQALRTIKPLKMLPALYELTAKEKMPDEIREELEKLNEELAELSIA